jgi:hypothetical protein
MMCDCGGEWLAGWFLWNGVLSEEKRESNWLK